MPDRIKSQIEMLMYPNNIKKKEMYSSIGNRTDEISLTFWHIESSRFFAECSIANDLPQLKRIFQRSLVIDTLFSVDTDIIAGRVQRLLTSPFDSRYGHPYDTAIAAYTWVLMQRGRYDYHFYLPHDSTIINNLFWTMRLVQETNQRDRT